MVSIKPVTPVVSRSDSSRGHPRPVNTTVPLEGEHLPREEAPPVARCYYERRSGSDRRQRPASKTYLDLRCGGDRRRRPRSRIDIRV